MESDKQATWHPAHNNSNCEETAEYDKLVLKSEPLDLVKVEPSPVPKPHSPDVKEELSPEDQTYVNSDKSSVNLGELKVTVKLEKELKVSVKVEKELKVSVKVEEGLKDSVKLEEECKVTVGENTEDKKKLTSSEFRRTGNKRGSSYDKEDCDLYCCGGSIRKSTRSSRKRICYAEDDLANAVYDQADIYTEDNSLSPNRIRLTEEIESIRKECEKIVRQNKSQRRKTHATLSSQKNSDQFRVSPIAVCQDIGLQRSRIDSFISGAQQPQDQVKLMSSTITQVHNHSISAQTAISSSITETKTGVNMPFKETITMVPAGVQDFGQYSTSEPFTIHRRRNSGEYIPDFRCIICELEFDFKHDMNYHMSKFHRMLCIRNSVSCSICVNGIPDFFQMSIDRDQKETITKGNEGEIQREYVVSKSVKTYPCIKCTHTFHNIELLHSHLRIYHLFDYENVRTCCSYCQCPLSGDVYEVRTLTGDLQQRTEKPYYIATKDVSCKTHLCKICHVQCKDESEVQLHQVLHTQCKKLKYKCLQCLKEFRKKDMLGKHVWMHYSKTPFRCRYCQKYTGLPHSLAQHEKSHLPKSKKCFKCQVCGKVCATNGLLKGHKLVHLEKAFLCNLCPCAYKTNFRLKQHKIKKHTLQFKYTCEICGKGIVSAFKLKIHRESHEDIVCKICSNRFSSYYSLSIHMQNQHGTQKKKIQKKQNIQCDQCGKIFRNKGALDNHYSIHTGEKNFKCGICSKSFRIKLGLDVHMRHHLGEKDYACTYCDKAFYTKLNLEDHIRVHTGEKPFKCMVCQKAFTKSCNLKKHKRLLKH